MTEIHLFNADTMPWSEDTRFPGIGVKILESRTTHPTTSVVLVKLDVGVVITTHVHAIETETAYVLSGQGTLKHGEQETVLETGMGVSIPPGLPHSMRNSGDAPLHLIAMHSPPTR
jgi:mannose-6-phosphate isomerase-like protein (cupin superfamily)